MMTLSKPHCTSDRHLSKQQPLHSERSGAVPMPQAPNLLADCTSSLFL